MSGLWIFSSVFLWFVPECSGLLVFAIGFLPKRTNFSPLSGCALYPVFVRFCAKQCFYSVMNKICARHFLAGFFRQACGVRVRQTKMKRFDLFEQIFNGVFDNVFKGECSFLNKSRVLFSGVQKCGPCRSVACAGHGLSSPGECACIPECPGIALALAVMVSDGYYGDFPHACKRNPLGAAV